MKANTEAGRLDYLVEEARESLRNGTATDFPALNSEHIRADPEYAAARESSCGTKP